MQSTEFLQGRFDKAHGAATEIIASGNLTAPALETAAYHLIGSARAYGKGMTKGKDGFDVDAAAEMLDALAGVRHKIRSSGNKFIGEFGNVHAWLDDKVSLKIKHHLKSAFIRG